MLAYICFRKKWLSVYLILLATMLVDLDHLLADPIFKADRCSIHLHPLHSYFAIAIYIFLLFLKKPFNIIGLGLLLHMCTDLIDCLFTYSQCRSCLTDAPALPLLQAMGQALGI